MSNYLAGNVVRLTCTFTRPAGSSLNLNPSTVKMAVTSPAGTSTALAPAAPTYNADNSAVTVTADWTIADNAVAGAYIITTDITGPMIAAHEECHRVYARVLATLP